MISNKLGHIQDNVYKLGINQWPVFLLDGKNPVLFDAGVSCAGKIYVERIRSILGNRQPSLLFITHVHWDHCGAVSYLKDAFPKMKVAASTLAAQIVQQSDILGSIKKLNQEMAGIPHPEIDQTLLINEPFETFGIDMTLQDNQVVDIGDKTVVKVLATPGHTREHLSYFIPKERVLIAGDAAGICSGSGEVSVEFGSDYDSYISSLRRLIALPTDVCCLGHNEHLIGREEIGIFFERSISETIRFKNRVLELLDEENGSVDRVVNKLKIECYDVIKGPKQPVNAYLMDLRALVANLNKNN